MAVRNLIVSVALVALTLGASANASDSATNDEIEYLIDAIGDSGCVFVRNGKRHDATEAEKHIRMKYRRARRHASTAEQFIKRLASKSSLSRKPYIMDCPGSDAVPSGDWLFERLTAYRESQN